MAKRKKRPSTKNEIQITLKLLKLHLRNHPENIRVDAIRECKRQLTELEEEEQDKELQRLSGIKVE